MMVRCLLIGGPKDGEWMEVRKDTRHVKFLAPIMAPALRYSSEVETIQYNRLDFLPAFVESGLMTDSGWLMRLVEHYRPGPKARNADRLHTALENLNRAIADHTVSGPQLTSRMIEAQEVLFHIMQLEGK